jgi:ubiquinone/menaquinone biosynthesis C-methylase UbiE
VHHHRLFNDKAELYESSRPTYPKEIYKFVASLCPSTTLAWDSACGNGQAAIGLVEEFSKVYATDVSKEQIENAKQHSQITYVVAPSEKTTLENESCDLVCVAQALHWFNYELFWPEVNRVLKPEGIFVTFGYNWPSINEKIDAAISIYFMKIIEPYWAQQNKLIWNHYRDLEIPFEKIESPNFLMQINWNLNEFFNFLHTFSATRRCMDAIGTDFFDYAYEQVAGIWGSSEDRKAVNLDFVFYAGRKKT